MALNLETIKTIQGLIAEMNTTATFLIKLRESKDISFTVGGITTKITGRDDDFFRPIFDSLYQVNSKKLDMLREKINNLLYRDDEMETKAEKA
jgi:hypothetical protein